MDIFCHFKFCHNIRNGYNWNGPRSHLGPWHFWSPGNLGSEKFGPHKKKSYDDFHAGTKFLGAHISQGPNFLGPKFLVDQISWGPKKPGAQMRFGTISVIAVSYIMAKLEMAKNIHFQMCINIAWGSSSGNKKSVSDIATFHICSWIFCTSLNFVVLEKITFGGF